MKIRLENGSELLQGLSYLAPELDIETVDDADVTVRAVKTDKNILKTELDGGQITVTYKEKASFFRGLATALDWLKQGKTAETCEYTPCFSTCGSMVDMSRNAVMKVETVKFMFRRLALMGQNMFMLYTEDTYEVDEYPYFGHTRGRYTKAQLREMDAYALALGIELIPCIQVLGHLGTLLKWGPMTAHKDGAETLMVGSEKTYDLIECMLKTITECFTTKRIHIGMDETHDLGTGRYLRFKGYKPKEQLYFEHLKTVKELLDKYGLEPMMWSDMFFRLAGKALSGFNHDYDVRVEIPDDMREKTSGVQQVFWEYHNDSEEFYAVNFEKHKKLGDNTVFAGGVWAWSGYAILYSVSRAATVPALTAAKKTGVKDVIATVWHNGAESNHILGLAGIAVYADFCYRGYYDEQGVKECFRIAMGMDYDDFMMLEELEKPLPTALTVSRPIFYNDPLIGTADVYFTKVDAKGYYGALTEKLKKASENKGMFTEAFRAIEKLSHVFELKTDFGLRLRAAYLDGKRDVMRAMADECDEIKARIEEFRLAQRAAWMKYYSPFGFEVHDIRMGGLLCRFDTAKARIMAYLDGEIDSIEELEADRLYLARGEDDNIANAFFWKKYQNIATMNIL